MITSLLRTIVHVTVTTFTSFALFLAYSNALLAADSSATPARPETFRQPSDNDDTQSINQALSTGRTVQLTAGKRYYICAPLIVHSHQELYGGPGTWIVACPKWYTLYGSTPQYKKLIRNEHWESTSIIDVGIMIHDIGIDGGNIGNPGNGRVHGIGFRMAHNIVAYDITCKDIGDCTAFQADEDYEVRDSLATGITNVGFDNWEGPKNGTVKNTRTYCAKGGAGVMFTGASTELRAARGANVTSDHNTVSGPCTVGIMFNNLSHDSSLTNIRSLGDSVDAKGTDSYGIVVQGNVNTGHIVDPTVSNTSTGQAISVRPERYQTGIAIPSNIEVVNASLNNDSTASGNIAPITVFGTGHKLVNIHLTGGKYDFAIQTNDHTLVPTGSIQPGEHGTIKVLSTPK